MRRINKKSIRKFFPYILIAFILLQTLSYKFSGHVESIDLFEKINLFGLPESYGRIGTGIIELLVSIGLFIKPLRYISLLGVITLMLGAVYFHITIIVFAGNNLALFISGLIALCTSIYLILNKKYK